MMSSMGCGALAAGCNCCLRLLMVQLILLVAVGREFDLSRLDLALFLSHALTKGSHSSAVLHWSLLGLQGVSAMVSVWVA